MKICFKLCSSLCWSVINELVKENVIPEPIGKDLKVFVATALFIRLSAYTHYDSLDNNITVWTAGKQDLETRVKREIWTIPKVLLQLFFTHLFPVKSAEQKFVNAGGEVDEDVDTKHFPPSGLTLYYCEDYKYFLVLTARAPESCYKTERWKLMRLVALKKSNRPNEALEMAHGMISAGEMSSSFEREVYNNKGSVYRAQGEYTKALEYCEKSLATKLTAYGDRDHPAIARSYNNIGLVFRSQQEYAKELECYTKSLVIQLSVYGDSNHPAIATQCCQPQMAKKRRFPNLKIETLPAAFKLTPLPLMSC